MIPSPFDLPFLAAQVRFCHHVRARRCAPRRTQLMLAGALAILPLACGQEGEADGAAERRLGAASAEHATSAYSSSVSTARKVPPAAHAALAADAASLTALAPILDGRLSAKTDFPATGAILYSSNQPGQSSPPIGAMICTGTLIAPDVVLAAGHCQENGIAEHGTGLDYYFSLQSDVSHFGPHVRAFPSDVVRVAHFEPHPDFGVIVGRQYVSHVADIALFYLERAMPQAPPATLLPQDLVSSLHAGQDVFIVGYGRRTLQFMGAGDGGLKTHGQSRLGKVEPFELQIGLGAGGAHKCWGDSGGPTYLADAEGALHLIGITSRAIDVQGCRGGGIDTRIDPYRAWIDASMQAACGTARRPACAKEEGTQAN